MFAYLEIFSGTGKVVRTSGGKMLGVENVFDLIAFKQTMNTNIKIVMFSTFSMNSYSAKNTLNLFFIIALKNWGYMYTKHPVAFRI